MYKGLRVSSLAVPGKTNKASGPKTEKIQDRDPGLKNSSGIENFKRATRQTPFFVGNSEDPGLKISSEIEIFDRDFFFLRLQGPLRRFRFAVPVSGSSCQELRLQAPYTGAYTPPSPEIPPMSQKDLLEPPRPECQKISKKSQKISISQTCLPWSDLWFLQRYRTGGAPSPFPRPLRMPKNTSKETYSVPPEGHILVKNMWIDSQVVQRYRTRDAPFPIHKAPRMPRKILLKNRAWYQARRHVCAKARLRNPEKTRKESKTLRCQNHCIRGLFDNFLYSPVGEAREGPLRLLGDFGARACVRISPRADCVLENWLRRQRLTTAWQAEFVGLCYSLFLFHVWCVGNGIGFGQTPQAIACRISYE